MSEEKSKERPFLYFMVIVLMGMVYENHIHLHDIEEQITLENQNLIQSLLTDTIPKQ